MAKEVNKKILYLVLIFVVGAVVGYIYEVIFYLLQDHQLINRGVLYGPYLPIYGAGAVLIYLLKPLKKHPALFFISVMLITGILEYVIGLYCLKVNHTKLWDYTGLFLNIQGLVCLRSIISFAIGGLILIYIVDPLLEKKVTEISGNTELAICSTFILIFITDIILSINFRTPPGP